MSWSPLLLILPRAPRRPRTQCPACAGGGEVNGQDCGTCGGRGWHDGANPAPERIP